MNVIVDRRMLKSDAVECFECGTTNYEAVVQLGEEEDNVDPTWHMAVVCLPCLKRAVAEAEAAVARDKA